MKTFFKKVTCLTVLLGLTVSCSDDFLDLSSQNALSPDSAAPSSIPTEAIQNSMYTAGWFEFNFKGLISLGDIYAGNAFAFDGEFRQFAEGAVNPDNPILNSSFDGLYKVVNQANSFIDLLNKGKGSIPQANYNEGIGVAKFMRATSLFYLVRMFGDVPLINENDKFGGRDIKRNLESDVYKFIVLDYEDAVSKLTDNPKKGRISKYSAMGMLAKVKLHQKKYTEAADLCQKVINSGNYRLVDNFGSMFSDPKSNNNPESLFSLQWAVDCSVWGTQNTEQAFIVPGGSGITGGGDGWGTYMPTTDLPKLFEAGDKRRKSSIMLDGDKYTDLLTSQGGYTYSKSASSTATNFRKYIVGSPAEGYNVCFMRTEQCTNMLRYADILLMYAEAKLAGGSSTSDAMALDAFNKVRARAGLSAVTQITQQSLFKERRVEFILEGQYYHDLARRNREDALKEIADQERGFYEDDDRTKLQSIKVKPTSAFFKLPIPSNAITNNPKLADEPVPYELFN
jgi:starch-binding outer membrane protein, SusD/RagB family